MSPSARYSDWIEKAEALFQAWGALAVFGGKFAGPLRPFVSLSAGAVSMAFPIFLLASATSSFCWAGLLLGPAAYGARVFLQ